MIVWICKLTQLDLATGVVQLEIGEHKKSDIFPDSGFFPNPDMHMRNVMQIPKK